MKSWIRRWGFGLGLGIGLALFGTAVSTLLSLSTPTNYRWLGTTIFNTGDQAVYLSYLVQGKHDFLLVNRFNDKPQQPRFDAFWSTAGLLVRLGLDPVLVHEILKVICSITLGLAIYATALSVANNEKEARVVSVLAASGLSTGWIYDVWMGLSNRWTPHSLATADLASEFSVAPVLIGGAHMILSFAIQLLVMRWIWQVIFEDRKDKLLALLACLLFVSFFHPYFIPLFALMAIISLALRPSKTRESWARLSYIISSLLPGTAYYLWVASKDHAFLVHHAQTNILPLDPWYFWIIMLLPFVPATIWLYRKRILSSDKRWLLIWMASALICMLFPFPWTRKYTQALLPVLVFITLPFWSFLWNRMAKAIWPLKACVLLFLAFPYIHLFQTQAVMINDAYWSKSFYAKQDFFEICHAINTKTPASSVLLATDQWSDHWLPSCSDRTVWLGHAHETPDFNRRITEYRNWQKAGDDKTFNAYFEGKPISFLISTSEEETQRIAMLGKGKWESLEISGGMSLWRRIN